MIYSYIITIISVIFSITSVLPALAAAPEVGKTNSICEATMSHESLIIDSISEDIKTIKAGEEFSREITIKNTTPAPFKNTSVLIKIFYYDKESSLKNSTEKLGKVIDVQLLPDLYNVGSGSTVTTTIKWKSSKELPTGMYRMDAYIVQNSLHVIGDYARAGSARKGAIFKIEGASQDIPVSISLDKTKLAGRPYEVNKMMPISEVEKNNTVVLSIKNTENKEVEAKLNWKVYRYGKFDNKNILTKSESIVKLKAKGDTKVELGIPTEPNDRYYGIADLEYKGQHRLGMMRWARVMDVPPSIDTYGIAREGQVIAATSSSADFAFKKGENYTVFACVIGGYKAASTTVTMNIKDEDGEVIFSKEEIQETGWVSAPFEYSFTPTKYVGKYELEVTAKTAGYPSVVTWKTDCKNKTNIECRNPSWLANIQIKYVIPIIVIIVLFLAIYIIRNNNLYKNQNEKK